MRKDPCPSTALSTMLRNLYLRWMKSIILGSEKIKFMPTKLNQKNRGCDNHYNLNCMWNWEGYRDMRLLHSRELSAIWKDACTEQKQKVKFWASIAYWAQWRENELEGWGLDYVRGKGFLSSPYAHQIFCSIGTRGSFLGVKRPGTDAVQWLPSCGWV